MPRKAQTGAAVLMILIIVFVIFYLLALPEEEKAKLLGEEYIKEIKEKNITEGEVLLQQSVGRLVYNKEKEVEHQIPSATLYLKEEGKTIKEKQTIYVESSVFVRKKEEIIFMLNPEDVKKLYVSFNLIDGSGRLIVKINGYEIYNAKVSKAELKPIEIPKEYLREENSLLFEVSSPGIIFWKKNFYSLKDIKIVAVSFIREAQKAENSFFITKEEYSKLEKGKLKFIVDCVKEKGKLTIKLNDYEIYSAAPDCDLMQVIEVDPSKIREGENKLNFEITSGSYVIYNIRFISELAKVEYPIYYFSVTDKQLEDIETGLKNAYLVIKFLEKDQQVFDININGKLKSFNRETSLIEYDISNYLQEGNNAIKIIPRKTLDILQLKIELR